IGGLRNSYVGNTCRAPFALRDADQGREQGYRKRRLGAHQAIAATAERTLPVADLGQRQRARRSSAPDIGHRGRRLLLRSSLSLAARAKRKHQQIAAPVPSTWHRSVPV